MALKAKSNDTDESSNDEDSKMKSYITRQFKKFMKMPTGRNFDKDCRQSWKGRMICLNFCTTHTRAKRDFSMGVYLVS